MESQSIQDGTRKCVDDNNHSAEISQGDGNKTINVNGVIATQHKCSELTTSISTTVTEDDPLEVFIHIIEDETGTPDCEECSAEIEYHASSEFNRVPESVSVLHKSQENKTTFIKQKRITEEN